MITKTEFFFDGIYYILYLIFNIWNAYLKNEITSHLISLSNFSFPLAVRGVLNASAITSGFFNFSTFMWRDGICLVRCNFFVSCSIMLSHICVTIGRPWQWDLLESDSFQLQETIPVCADYLLPFHFSIMTVSGDQRVLVKLHLALSPWLVLHWMAF
jgi:hypothetical protein